MSSEEDAYGGGPRTLYLSIERAHLQKHATAEAGRGTHVRCGHEHDREDASAHQLHNNDTDRAGVGEPKQLPMVLSQGWQAL